MRFNVLDITVKLCSAVLVLGFALPLAAQARPATQFGLDPGQTAAMELGADYAYFHANAPPSQCGCFSLEGVGGGFAINAPHGLSLVADLATAEAKGINGTLQNIRIVNYLAGPRYSYRTSHKFTPYAQVLLGGSEELSNYTFVRNRNAFAASGGGGINRTLNKYIGWKIVEASYVYSRLPNAGNDHQNDLRVSTGFFLRIGPR